MSMKRFQLNRSRSTAQGGFTLIELVMVIVVLGILASAALVRYKDLSSAAALAAAKDGVTNISTAYNAAQASQGALTPNSAYPLLSDVIAGLNNGKAATGNAGICAASGYAIATYSDAAGTTPTAALTDKVLYFTRTPIVDTGC